MRVITATLMVFGLAAFDASHASAQSNPLTGRWAVSPRDSIGISPSPNPILGQSFELRLDGEAFTITRPLRGMAMQSRLPWSGTQVATATPGSMCEGETRYIESVQRMRDTVAFLIHGVGAAGGGPVSELAIRRLIYPLAGDANALVAEATVTMGGQARRMATVYRRTTDTLPAAAVAPLPTQGIAATIAQVSWIGRQWAGTTNGLTTEERWTPTASGGMIGVARSLRGNTLSSFEFLCIAERGSTLVYFAMPNGRSPATPFVLTAVTDTSAQFENPSNSYPAIITYRRTSDGGLETIIAGPGGNRPRSVRMAAAPASP